jgi:hypothetical protein
MVARFTSARVQAALSTPTGYRRRFRFTFERGGVSRQLEPIAGSFTQDARRSGRWDGQLTFMGDEFMPERPGDLLTPFGTTLTAEVGLELLDGTTSYLPYGRYDVDTSSAEISADDRSITVRLIDLSDRIDRYRFETPFTVPANTTLSLMVNQVVTNRIGFNPVLNTIPIQLGTRRIFGLETSTGPWEEILEVLDAFSLVAWYRRDGLIAAANPNPATITPYPITTVTSISPDFDSRPPNVIVARGESTDDAVPPVQAVAMDTDPGSPTYAGTGPGTSPYGRKTEYYSSPQIKTVAQAQSAAQAILAANLGAAATYTLTMPFDPTVDAMDVVSFRGDTYVIDAVTLDINGETTCTARKLS